MKYVARVSAKLALLILLAASVFIKPPKTYSAPFCATYITYYDDATFTNAVGYYDTTSCTRAYMGGIRNTGYYINVNYGACGTPCSQGDDACVCASWSEAVCANGSCTYY